MIIQLSYEQDQYQCDLSQPLTISIPLGQVRCFFAPRMQKSPVEIDDFIGSVKKGGPVNFFDISFNPHGHGTHTESIGHLTAEQQTLHSCLTNHHFIARLISVPLSTLSNGDYVLEGSQLRSACPDPVPEALIIRTLPNHPDKLTKDYSGTNPPYLSREAMEFIVRKGVKHLLVDLPSVDREDDGGQLANHRLFWNLPEDKITPASRMDGTITELIYVTDEIVDGLYFLNLQAADIGLDAAPCQPVLYTLSRKAMEAGSLELEKQRQHAD